MSIKQALLIIVLGSGALVSINALNTIFYTNITWFLIFQIIAGPALAFFLLTGKYKKYQIRMIVFIFTLAGAVGLLQILGEIARLYLYGNDLRYPASLYIYHSLVSFIFLAVFLVWYVFDKKSKSKARIKSAGVI